MGTAKDIIARRGQGVRVQIGQVHFLGTTVLPRDRALILQWGATTDLANIVWVRLIVLRLGRHPFRKFTGLVDTETDKEAHP